MKKSSILTSAVLGIVLMLAVFSVLMVTGVFEGNKEKLVFKSASAEKAFDGTELTNSEWEMISGNLKKGHYVEANVYGSQTNASQTQNLMSVVIRNEKGKDVTHLYDIEYQYGELKVNPAVIKILASSASKQYDGAKLESKDYEQKSGMLANGHSLVVELTGERTEVGESENTALVKAQDAYGNDVSSNYIFDCQPGALVVTPRSITIQSPNAKKTYDGTPLTSDNIELIAGEIYSGHTIEYNVTGTITDTGKVQNTFGVVIVDSTGKDVTYNYAITYIYGELEVVPRPVIIRSESAEKEYDGAPLTCDEWDIVSETGIVDGHTLTLDITGEQTEIGQSDNTILNAIVTDANGNIVNFNYDLSELQLGKLVVTDAQGNTKPQEPEDPGDEDPEDPGDEDPEEPGDEDPKDPGDGDLPGTKLDFSGEIKGGASGAEDLVVLRIFSTQSGPVYLRGGSLGNYNGRKWDQSILPYSALIDGAYSANYLTGLSLQNSGMVSTVIEIESIYNNFVLPTYLDNDNYNYDIQTSDTIYDGKADENYAAYYYNYNLGDELTIIGVPDEYKEYEEAYRSYVYENYLKVKNSTNLYLQSIIATQGFSKDDPEIISKVATYIQSSAKYNAKYNSQLDSEDDVVYAFLTKYQEGICQHFASAGTLLFRAIGIPARYTLGYSAQTIEGEWAEVKNSMAHAWVEVYLDSIGWVAVEVTAGGPGGGITPSPEPGEPVIPDPEEPVIPDPEEPEIPDPIIPDIPGPGGEGELKKIEVTPKELYKKYDGSIYYAPADGGVYIHEKVLNYLQNRGYTYEYQLSGSQDGIGYGHSKIDWFKVYDYDKNDITDQFEIVLYEGLIHVYEIELYVASNSYTGVYDGTAPNQYYSFYIDVDGEQRVELLEKSHRLEVTFNALSANVQYRDNTFLAKVTSNGENVSVRYRIIHQNGKINITPRVIEITTDSAEKVYDETPLTCETWKITDGTLCDGHKEHVITSGSQTTIGRSSNEVESVVIFDSSGMPVTSNYTIIIKFGTLKVKPY